MKINLRKEDLAAAMALSILSTFGVNIGSFLKQ
jgi:hypothetical protein